MTRKRQREKVLYKFILAVLFFLSIGMATILLIILLSFLLGYHIDIKIVKATDSSMGGTFAVTDSYKVDEDDKEIFVNTDLRGADHKLLVLVNKDHPLDMQYDSELRSICNGRLKASTLLYDDLCDMLSAAEEAGYRYWISSAYRSRDYQQELVDEDVRKYMGKGYSYEEALKKTYEYTQPAGCSEHETGLALDILCSTNTDIDEQEAEPGNKWLAAHCQEYGFILRYPKGKEKITGISYEPWHFRYVGKGAAKYIMEHGLTLEEFL